MTIPGRKLSAILRGKAVRSDTQSPKRDWRGIADAARDRGNWVEAADAYRNHLATNADDGPIWVQAGHALKESGRATEAETAYRRALTLMPEDADLHLQVGHLMKRMGRTDEAARSYETSLRLVPTPAAHRELHALDRKEIADHLLSIGNVAVAGNRVYLQINDFLAHLRHHKTVSGIQRVQLGLINHILNGPVAKSPRNIRFVFTDIVNKRMWLLQDEHLRALADNLSTANVSHPTLLRLIDVAMDTAQATRLHAGDVCIITGSFWGNADSFDVLRDGILEGACAGVFFHDMLPVSHPEFFDPVLSADFRQLLGDVLSLIDFGLSNSDATAREVKQFAAVHGFAEIPVTAVKLAHSFGETPSRQPESTKPDWPAGAASLQGQRYVLCVGTIEVRKNHRYLFDAWKALIAEGVDVPRLVFVGRRGWRVNDLFAQFESTHYLDDRIVILHDLSDEELATLYRNCLFTTFPSLVEGWGLPIGESLSYGKACVASNTSSMPEVGGDLVDYIDPLNLRAGIETFRRLITDPTALARREADIRTRFRPRSWDDVGADFVRKLDDATTRIMARPRIPLALRVAHGEIVPLSSGNLPEASDPGRAGKSSVRLGLTGAWYRPEPIGSWLAPGDACLTIATDVGPNVPILVYLRFTSVIWATENTLTVDDGGAKPIRVKIDPAKPFALRVKTATTAAGTVTLKLKVGGKMALDDRDTRPIRVALTKFAYAAQNDPASRVAILEQFLI